MRPLFLADPDAPEAWDQKLYSYLLGPDVLVAPVVEAGADTRALWLPSGEWIQLWSGERYTGGRVTVPAPLGQPPVFYRAASPFAPLFAELNAIQQNRQN